ncbi:MAG: OmpA family protein, partial [Paludibacteraceae bacterium]|nr:OmpA family protein [Paludibacteraceae bacterium]
IKKELRTLLKKAMQGIQFETNKAVILPSSFAILNRIAVQFIEHPEYVIEVQGHTDNTGKYEMNVDLSQHRAESVREFLINAGVPDTQLTAKGYGPDKPIADNETIAGRAQNRRVEFDITFEQVQIQTIYEHADSISVETLNVKQL